MQTCTTAGRFGWNELNVPDAAAARKFYGEVFGWESDTQEMAPGMEYTMFKQGDHMVAGLVSPLGAENAPPTGRPIFTPMTLQRMSPKPKRQAPIS